MRILLLVNPSASSVTPRAQVVIQKALSADHEVRVAETTRRGHAARLAQGSITDGVDVVAVLGGDGTLNEAANGLAGSQTALAALPGGSTNVFARTIGVPDDAVEATGVLLDALAHGSVRRVGLGSVNGRYFLFHVGIGLDAAVVEQVEKRASLKRYASHPLFVAAALDTWLRRYSRTSQRFTVEHPDGSVVADALFAVCMNTNPYTYLGSRPLDIAPEATLDRGLVAITFRSLGVVDVARALGTAFGGRRSLRDLPAIDYRTDLTGCVVRGHSPFPYQVDGDYLGEVTTLRFRHEPEVLDLVMPTDSER